MKKPIVAIVGRPNVGKSTFFNRCIGGRHAIVDDIAGVTRDRIYQDADWSGYDFVLVDTGGLTANGSRTEIEEHVYLQSLHAIQEATVIVFVVDGKAGIVPADREIANLVRRLDKPIVIAVNKIDDPKDEANVNEFYALGIDAKLIGMSGLRGSGGVGDVLDEVVGAFPKEAKRVLASDEGEEAEFDPSQLNEFSVALVGKPNVGKSSIVNVLCGSNRSIVTPIAGTTRDAIDTTVRFHGKEITLIDTAGIRRKSKVDYGVEAFSVTRSIAAIDRADVSILILDASEPISDQDQKIGAKIEDAGRAVVIVFNKWDLIEDKSSRLMKQFEEEAKRELRYLDYAEVLFVSAMTKQRILKIVEAAERAVLANRKKVSTSLLNQVITEAQALSPPPPAQRGRRLKIYYSTQVAISPPTFLMFVNEPKLVNQSYETYLKRKIREAFGFNGSPLRIKYRPKERNK